MAEWADVVFDKRLRGHPHLGLMLALERLHNCHYSVFLMEASVWSTMLCIFHGSTSTPHTDFIRS